MGPARRFEDSSWYRSKMKRSNIPMLRQHSHPPAGAAASMLSPTTTAAKVGIKLNDPALRNVAVSTSVAAPNNNAAGGASADTAMAHANNYSETANISSSHSGNDFSTMTPSQGKLPPFTLVRSTSGDKENNINSKDSHQKDSKPAAVAKYMDSLNDELTDFCDSESVSQQPDAQMMDLDDHESEPMMADDVISNGSTLQQTESNHVMNHLDEFSIDDGDGDDDGSDCSGDTVVAMEKPPAGLTQEELNKYYWEICYGPGYVPPPTVLKSVPTKSW